MICQFQYWNDEVERNAYNAAFYELGFRWYWDSPTYYELLTRIPDAADRICHYLKTRQPPLAARVRREIPGRSHPAEAGRAPQARPPRRAQLPAISTGRPFPALNSTREFAACQ
jgi:hypothetical protein